MTYGDCSWANAQDYKSQEGLLVCLTTPGALQGPTDAVMLDWKSPRTPRVVRSTLAGEACAADDAIDRGVYVNQCLCELIFGANASPLSNPQYLRHLHATDCKSLFEATIAANFQTEEKRVGLTIRSIPETIAPTDMRWVPTGAMHADGLTKVADWLRSQFLDWILGILPSNSDLRCRSSIRSEGALQPRSGFTGKPISHWHGFWTNKKLGVSVCNVLLQFH